MQYSMSFVTIEGTRLDVQYVFFYKGKISRLDGTLWQVLACAAAAFPYGV
jgi:hypothetical protein